MAGFECSPWCFWRPPGPRHAPLGGLCRRHRAVAVRFAESAEMLLMTSLDSEVDVDAQAMLGAEAGAGRPDYAGTGALSDGDGDSGSNVGDRLVCETCRKTA